MSYKINYITNEIIYRNDSQPADNIIVFKNFTDAKKFALNTLSVAKRIIAENQKEFKSIKKSDVIDY